MNAKRQDKDGRILLGVWYVIHGIRCAIVLITIQYESTYRIHGSSTAGNITPIETVATSNHKQTLGKKPKHKA